MNYSGDFRSNLHPELSCDKTDHSEEKSADVPRRVPMLWDASAKTVELEVNGIVRNFHRWFGSSENSEWPTAIARDVELPGMVYSETSRHVDKPVVYNASIFDLQVLQRGSFLTPFVSWSALLHDDPDQDHRYVLIYPGITTCTSHPHIM